MCDSVSLAEAPCFFNVALRSDSESTDFGRKSNWPGTNRGAAIASQQKRRGQAKIAAQRRSPPSSKALRKAGADGPGDAAQFCRGERFTAGMLWLTEGVCRLHAQATAMPAWTRSSQAKHNPPVVIKVDERTKAGQFLLGGAPSHPKCECQAQPRQAKGRGFRHGRRREFQATE